MKSVSGLLIDTQTNNLSIGEILGITSGVLAFVIIIIITIVIIKKKMKKQAMINGMKNKIERKNCTGRN